MLPVMYRRSTASAHLFLIVAVAVAFAGGLLGPQNSGDAATPASPKQSAHKSKKSPTKTKPIAAAHAVPPGDLTAMLETFPAGSKLLRGGKAIAGVHAGSSAVQGDTIANISRKSLDLTLSGLARMRLRPGTQLDLTRLLSKHTPNGDQTLDVSLKVRKGVVLLRLRPLTGQQTFQLEAPGAVTAPRGTGYAIVSGGSKAKIVVAEGHVASWLPGYPDNVLVIPPNQMATFDGNVPAAPEPITDKEQPLAAEIMKLRWPGQPPAVAGPTAPASPVGGQTLGSQPGDALISSVDPGPVTEVPSLPGRRFTDPYTIDWKWKPTNSVGSDRTTIWASDANGVRRVIARGMYFECVSEDGKTVYASKPNKGLWAISLDGKSTRQVTNRPVANCGPVQGTSCLSASLGWRQVPYRSGSTTLRWIYDEHGPKVLVIPDAGTCLPIADAGAESSAFWFAGGKVLLCAVTTDYVTTEIFRVNRDGSGRATIARRIDNSGFEIPVPNHAPIRIAHTLTADDVPGFSDSLRSFVSIQDHGDLVVYDLADGSARTVGHGVPLRWLLNDTAILEWKSNDRPMTITLLSPSNAGAGTDADVAAAPSRRGDNVRDMKAYGSLAAGSRLIAWTDSSSGTLCLLDAKHPERILRTSIVVPRGRRGQTPRLRFSADERSLRVGSWPNERMIRLNVAKLDSL